MSEVKYEVQQGVAVLTMSRGRANALAPGLRAALSATLDRAAEAEDVVAVVLRGAGEVFSSGVDIGEYDAPLAAPWIDVLALRIETFPKPVVAATHGAALGAGLELALAAHGRVAVAGTRLAQPEVTLGLVPGGGATQRLPRLMGAQAALTLMLAGRAVGPDDPRLRRLFDAVVEGDPMPEALALARRLAQAGTWTRACDVVRGFSDPEAYQKAIGAVADRITDPIGAEADVLRCVEAAQLLPFEQGLAFEQTVFQERISSATARAVRHVYTAERRAQVHPGTQGVRPRDIQSVALIGEDLQLAQLAVYCLDRGHRAFLGGPKAEALQARATGIYDAAVQRGRMKAAARDQALARLEVTDASAALAAADLVLEGHRAEIGDARPKPQAIWCVLDDAARAEARAVELGLHVVALRVYRPAHSSALAEFAAPEKTPADIVASVVGYFGAQGRSVLRCVAKPGLLGHRVMSGADRAALALVRAGADPFDVDRAAMELGFGRGIFRRMEAEGLPTVAERLAHITHGDTAPELQLHDAMVSGEGHGFYRNTEAGITQNPDSAQWLSEWRKTQSGLRDLPAGVALTDALHAALVNSAARMIDGREVLRASDIDLCLVRGYDFARDKGGPLLQADIRGLLPLVRVMKALGGLSDSLWAPAPLVEEMVKYGRRFF